MYMIVEVPDEMHKGGGHGRRKWQGFTEHRYSGRQTKEPPLAACTLEKIVGVLVI